MEKLLKLNLELLIHDLLLSNDCIVVPKFGAFICNYKSAYIETNKSLILPPSKEISFNSGLTQNDGILSTKIAQILNCSYAEALKYLEVHVNFWKNKLLNQNYLELNELGSFKIDENNKWIFKQNTEINFLNEGFGLTPIKINPIHHQSVIDTSPIHVVKNKPQNQFKKIAIAASIFLPLLMGSIWVSIQKSQNKNIENLELLNWLFPPANIESSTINQKADFDISINEVKSFFNEDEIKTLEKIGHIGTDSVWKTEKGQRIWEEDENSNKSVDEIKNKYTETDNEKLMIEENSYSVNKKIIPNNVTNAKFAIIAGCFSKIENAQKYVIELNQQGYNATLFGVTKSNLYRVAIGTYSNQDEAIEQLNNLRFNFSGSTWLLNN